MTVIMTEEKSTMRKPRRRSTRYEKTQDVADFLGVNVSTIQNYCIKGKMSFHEVNGYRKITIRDVEKYQEENNIHFDQTFRQFLEERYAGK